MPLLNIFKPKWQHPDPAVRRQAVEELPPDDRDTLTSIAREDTVPAIRQLALRRIDDLDVIHAASIDDSEKDVREFARSRLSQLLADNRGDGLPLERRLNFLTAHPDADLLKFVALNGSETTLRKTAQDRIEHEPVLREIAVNDPDPDNRLAALERITQTPVLEAVYRDTRKSDKRVSREAKTRLDARREAEERPARIRAESEQICAYVESLGKSGRWQQDRVELERLEKRWQAVVDETDEAYRQRYDTARQSFLAAFAEFDQAREAEQRRWAEISATREALLAQIEPLAAQLQETPALAKDDEAAHRSRLNAWRADWQAQPALPDELAQPLNRRFQEALDAIRARLEHLHAQRILHTLAAEADALLGNGKPVREQEILRLEKRWKELRPNADREHLADDMQRAEKQVKLLRERLRRQLERRDGELQKLPGMLDELQVRLDEKALKQAGPLHDRIQSSLGNLRALGVPREHIAPLAKRLLAMTAKIRELRRWRNWGTDEVRERLCTEMEALLGQEKEPPELSNEITRLREEWNHLGSDGTAAQRALRKRFDKAAAQAHKPCQAYFRQQSDQRAKNLEARQTLCEGLEAYAASVDWSHADWKAVLKTQRQFADRWRGAGPVDHRENKAINQRYRQAMSLFEEHLDHERERNLRQRETLVEKVRALQDVEDVRKAVDECKQLQQQWQVTVPGKRKREDVVWKSFREACDAVFARRRQQQDERRDVHQQHKALKQALCERVEALSKVTLQELPDAEAQLHKAAGEWNDIGPADKRDEAALEQRFARAGKAFERHSKALRDTQQRTQLDCLRDKAALCREAERLLEEPDPDLAQNRLHDIDARWNTLPALTDTATENRIQQRYARAREAITTTGEETRQRLLSELSAGLAARQELCLRMEILAGVESPPEAREARMQLQTRRLAGAFGHGEVDIVGNRATLEHDWYLCAAAPAAQEAALQQRFEHALGQCRSGDA